MDLNAGCSGAVVDGADDDGQPGDDGFRQVNCALPQH